jgi:hypothetical protein
MRMLLSTSKGFYFPKTNATEISNQQLDFGLNYPLFPPTEALHLSVGWKEGSFLLSDWRSCFTREAHFLQCCHGILATTGSPSSELKRCTSCQIQLLLPLRTRFSLVFGGLVFSMVEGTSRSCCIVWEISFCCCWELCPRNR